MKKIKMGVIGTADIAFRRFLPSLLKSDHFEYVGIASRNYKRTEKFVEKYGGKVFLSYEDLLNDAEVEAVYLPLPPSLHYEWAKKTLERGKHVLIEKPFTTRLENTEEILKIAKDKELAVHENYMFVYHSQLEKIKNIIQNGKLGDIWLYRIAFGFPKRGAEDFRYNKKLGGGALLDCGGYPIKLASDLLGNTATVTTSNLNFVPGCEVDLFGTATLKNNDGQIAQVSFGMDNAYKCELEVWGSKGSLVATRIFTAGADFEPKVIIKLGDEEHISLLPSDDQFLGSINHFLKGIFEETVREEMYMQIRNQSKLVENIIQRRR